MPRTNRSESRLTPVSAAFVKNRDFLSRYLRRYFARHQDIEDVVQETFLRAYISEQRNEIVHPKGFLFQVAKNVALTELTRKSRQITDYLEESGIPVVAGAEASVHEEIEAQEMLGLYCEAIASLSDKCREVFLLRKVHGLRHKEIAERMSLWVSSVAKYLRQGALVCEAVSRQDNPPRSLRSMQRKP